MKSTTRNNQRYCVGVTIDKVINVNIFRSVNIHPFGKEQGLLQTVTF